MEDVNPALGAFVQEAREILENLETMLLDLEGQPQPEQVDAVFRALHTIKGSGSMFGFGILARFTHHFEDAFDKVRDGLLSIDDRLIDLSLKARDHMSALLSCGGDCAEAEALEASAEAARLLRSLSDIVGSTAPDAPQPPAEAARERRWRIRFRPEASALRNGMRPDLLIAELAQMGQTTISFTADDLPALSDLDPATSHLCWSVELLTHQPLSEIEAVFIFVDDAELKIAEVTEQAQPAAKAAPPPRKAPEAAGENVRVAASKLDEIMDQLGELVIAQARLSQLATATSDPDLETMVEELERLVTGLRDSTLSIRMLPIEMVFGKFRRVVRDLSAELGKDVALVTEGGETEVDKTVIDRLSEPLVHMIRNSLEDARIIFRILGPPPNPINIIIYQGYGGICADAYDDQSQAGCRISGDHRRTRHPELHCLDAHERPERPDHRNLGCVRGIPRQFAADSKGCGLLDGACEGVSRDILA